VSFGNCVTATMECAMNVEQLATSSASLAVHWWIRPSVAVALAGYRYSWSADPYDQMGVRSTWLALARLTLSVR
jgi:hypothetical protein